MALDLRAIMGALAGQIEAGLADRTVTVRGFRTFGVPLPAVLIELADADAVEYHRTMSPTRVGDIDVRVSMFVSAEGDDQLLLAMLSSGTTSAGSTVDARNSVVDAIEADPTLGGVVASAIVTSGRSLSGVVTFGDPAGTASLAWGAELDVTIYCNRS
jgi:hypothetical protein